MPQPLDLLLGNSYFHTMVITGPGCDIHLENYGILIPIRESRHRKTLAYLLDLFGPGEWLEEIPSHPLDREALELVHDKSFLLRLLETHTREELMLTYELRDPTTGEFNRYSPDKARLPLEDLLQRLLCQGFLTQETCRRALKTGFEFFLGGGMHHALYDRGAGFCPFNDIIVAIRTLQKDKLIKTVWVVDVDAHKGDGTAALTQGDPDILTLSIHTAEGWPMDQAKFLPDGQPNPCHLPSTVDIEVGARENETYLPRLLQGLQTLAGIFIPDLAVVVCGADPYEEDELPSASGLKLTLGKMLQRDNLVYNFLQEKKIPQAYLMAGGYGEHVWKVYAQFLEEKIGEKYEKRHI